MNQTSTDSKSAAPWLWPLQALSAQFAALAPQSLYQPLTFGNIIVNEKNSRSPETERDILAEQSYGRQLGRLMDAVALLIDERPEDLPRPKAFDELQALRAEIEAIKQRSAASRLDRLESDLARLKIERPDEYRRIAAAMAREV
jgi:hypothetical protein